MTRVFSARSSDDEHMHLFEVAHWIALGLMPDPGYRMDRDKIMDMHGAQWTPTLWLTEAEVAMLLPGVPVEEYMHLREICLMATPEELMERDRSYMGNLWESARADADYAMMLAEKEIAEANELDAAKQMKALHVPLNRAINRARVDVLSALMDGKLIGTGLLAFGSDETEWADYRDFEEIKPDEWTMWGVDFESSNLAIKGGCYFAVTVPISDCLRVFSGTMVEPRRVSGWLHGSTIILDEGESNTVKSITRPRPGRTPMGDGMAEIAVLHAMQMRRSELPRKKEAILAEAQEWYLAHFNKPLSRSTAQRYLAPLLATLPKLAEEMPISGAELPRGG